jgi:hypothetical protein
MVLLCGDVSKVCPYMTAHRKLPPSPAQIFSKPNPVDLAESIFNSRNIDQRIIPPPWL